jgi:catechol 2,3-dioxygenase-like lactoylglutathione lyase family enzyme
MSGCVLDHIGLTVHDVEASAKFYIDYAGMQIIHERVSNGVAVKWIQMPDQTNFMIVMIENREFKAEGRHSLDHFGIHVHSREHVDSIAERAKKQGCLVLDAYDGGPILGYLCEVRDPDGNVLEFAFDQAVADKANDVS